MPLFVIENANTYGWIRELATLIHIKDVRRSGYFDVNDDLSVDINTSKSTIYRHLEVLIKNKMVEKVFFKTRYTYKCVSKEHYHTIFKTKKENFLNKVLVEKTKKNATHTVNHLLLKILEQHSNQQKYNGFKNRLVNKDKSKTFLKLTRDGKDWFNRAFNNSVIFDDRGIAQLIGVSKSKANSLKHYLRKKSFITISLLYREVVPECNKNSYLLYNKYYKELSKDIPFVTYLNKKIVYNIGTEYCFKLDYSKFNGSANKYLL